MRWTEKEKQNAEISIRELWNTGTISKSKWNARMKVEWDLGRNSIQKDNVYWPSRIEERL